MGKREEGLDPLGEHTLDDAVLPEIKGAGEHKTTRRKIIEIVRQEGEISRKDLEERLDVTTARISEVLNDLEEEGWLRREGKRGRTSNRKLVFTGKFKKFFWIPKELDKLCKASEETSEGHDIIAKAYGIILLGGLWKAKKEETEKMRPGILQKQFLDGLSQLILPQNTEEILKNTKFDLGETELSGLELIEDLFSRVEKWVKTPPSEKYGGDSDE